MLEEEDPTITDAVVSRSPRQLRQRVRQGRETHLISVETGFVFSLTTTDPVSHPLPHPDLLTIHASLMRIARAAGAANMTNIDDWAFDDNGSNMPVLEGVQQDLGYALREYLNDLNGTGLDNGEQR